MTEGMPKLLSAIITRMVAKKPEDRYQDMGEVVGALEQFLGVESAGQFAPRQEHAALLEECAAAYNDAPAAGLRRRLTVGFAILCTLAAVLSARFGWPLVAAGAVGLGLLTGLFHFAVHGLARKTVLFTKFRQLALGGSLADSAAWVLVGAVFAGVLCLLGLQWAFLVLCAAALALALGLHFLVDRKAGLQRGEPLGQVRELLRDMRLRGLGEDALRQFVCHCGSERWEPLYEALFGYEAKLQARKESGKGEAGRIGKKSGAWRDPIVEWVDARLKARREAREKEHLEAIEAGALEAKGVSESQAVAEARQAAGEMLAQAATMKESVIEAARAAGEMMAASHAPEPRPADGPAAEAPPARPTRSKAMRRRVEAERALDLLLGARTRFILGALLIAACLVWMKQNGMLPGARFKSAIEHRDRGDATGLVEDIARTSKKQRTPLKLPLLSESVAAGFFNSFNPALAGLLLILSTLFPGPRMALFIIPAAAIVMVGHVLVLPSLGPIRREHMSMVIGGALAALGLLCGRERGR
jgi:hypothetical protein